MGKWFLSFPGLGCILHAHIPLCGRNAVVPDQGLAKLLLQKNVHVTLVFAAAASQAQWVTNSMYSFGMSLPMVLHMSSA